MRKVGTKLVLAALGGVLVATGLNTLLGPKIQAMNPYILIGGGIIVLLIVKGKLGLKLF